nr:immunoglobulin light chain junction region [Macaca mulatta]
CQQESNWPSF